MKASLKDIIWTLLLIYPCLFPFISLNIIFWSFVYFYRLTPSVFSTCSNSKTSTEFFFKMEPSEISSGCFLAILAREVS